jgi:hypothetical protein
MVKETSLRPPTSAASASRGAICSSAWSVSLQAKGEIRYEQGRPGRRHGCLHWEPDTPLDEGLAVTYAWIREQYEDRKQGKKVVE